MILLSLCFSSERYTVLDMLIPCLMVEEVEVGKVRILFTWNFAKIMH